MPDRRCVTVLDDLPEEIVVDQILVRLRARDVGRCRAVRTSWRTATSTPEFMLRHHRRQPSLPIVERDSLCAFHVAGDKVDFKRLWPFVPYRGDGRQIHLHAVSEGLLIVSKEPKRFYICNPTIREHALLPQPELGQDIYNIVLGLYRHSPTGEYRVLWWSLQGKGKEARLYVLTVGADDEPRRIRVTLSMASSPFVEQSLLRELYLCSYRPPVYHRGNLHWHSHGVHNVTGDDANIIVFDTAAESFRCMRSPGFLERLFDMDGKLALCSYDYQFTALHVWAMEDYEAEIWDLKYRIDVGALAASRPFVLNWIMKEKKKGTKRPLESTTTMFRGMTVLNDRELLVQFCDEYVSHYDVDGKFVGMANFRKIQYHMELTPHRLQESIVPIPFRGVREDGGSLHSPHGMRECS